MKEIIKYVLGGFWRFVGAFALLGMIVTGLVGMSVHIQRIIEECHG